MKALITGGAGYKGIILTSALLEKGHEVTVIDNFMYGSTPIIHLLHNKKLKIHKVDIRNDISEYVKNADIIFHLGAISGYPACEANPNSSELINVVATRNLVKFLSKDQRIVYASTTSFYGKSGELLDEESDIDAVSIYGRTKYRAEQIIMEHNNAISLRFATLFGVSPKMRIDLLVNDFTFKAVNDRCIVLFEGKTKRTFLHVKDAINAYILCADKFDEMKHNVFNVGSNDMNYTKLEIAEHIKKYTNCTIIDSEIKDLDLRNFMISFDKINKMGFSAKYGLDDGIEEMSRLYSFYKPHQPFKTI